MFDGDMGLSQNIRSLNKARRHANKYSESKTCQLYACISVCSNSDVVYQPSRLEWENNSFASSAAAQTDIRALLYSHAM